MKRKLFGVREELAKALLGKSKESSLALACVLSGGHLLIEDLPGMGKVDISKAMAKL